MDVVVDQRRNQLQLLSWQLQLIQQHNVNNMVILQVLRKSRKVEKRRQKRRTVWVRPWLERRIELGQYTQLMEELKVEDVNSFKNFTRMDPEMFNELLVCLTP